MKKILSFTLLAAAAAMIFTGCKNEEDDLFDSSAADRLESSKSTFTQRLASAETGWTMEYYPTNGEAAPQGLGYLMLARFDKNGSVRIAMQNDETQNRFLEDTSVWEMIADQGPVLSFNTYNNVLHYFSNPAFLDQGLGFEGDYEFEVISLEENAQTAMLKGKKRGTYIRLTRLAEGTDFADYLADINHFKDSIFSKLSPSENRLYMNGQAYDIHDAGNGIMEIFPWDGDAITQTKYFPYLITKRDGSYYLRMRDELRYDSINNNLEQEFRFNPEADRFEGVKNASNTVQGDNPAHFFASALSAKSSWNFNEQGSADDFNGKVTALVNAMKAKSRKYEIRNSSNQANTFTLEQNSDSTATVSFTIRWSEKNSRGTYTTKSMSLAYVFSMTQSSDGLTLSYVEPLDANSVTMDNSTPAIGELMQAVSGTYSVVPFTTAFDLRTMKLVSTADAAQWITVRYKK